MTLHYQGAYNGVPFKIEYDEGGTWDLVDPLICMNNGGIFLGYALQHATYHHVNYGDKHIKFAEGALTGLLSANYDKIIRNAKKALGKEKWEAQVNYFGDPETAEEYMLDEDIAQALKEGDIKTITKYLDYAKIDYVAKELQGDSQSDFCRTLYFKEEGQKISAHDKREYEAQLEDINNWLWGNVFQVEIPLDACSGFVDEPMPEHDENSTVMCYIQEEIDRLRKNKSGKYIVTVPAAETVSEENGGEITFNAQRPIKIYAATKLDAQIIAEWYDDKAVITKNPKEQGQGI